jgi:hypothetical protein
VVDRELDELAKTWRECYGKVFEDLVKGLRRKGNSKSLVAKAEEQSDLYLKTFVSNGHIVTYNLRFQDDTETFQPLRKDVSNGGLNSLRVLAFDDVQSVNALAENGHCSSSAHDRIILNANIEKGAVSLGASAYDAITEP